MNDNFYEDAHYFRGKHGNYYITKPNIAGIYETFLITEEIKEALLIRDNKFKEFLQENNPMLSTKVPKMPLGWTKS